MDNIHGFGPWHQGSNPCRPIKMVDCLTCEGECCKKFAIEIDKPETKEDFLDIKWYLAHKNVYVYIDRDNEWLVQFNSKCKFLKNGKCKIYENRFPICKDYKPEECEINSAEVKVLFKNIKEYEEYLKRNNILDKLRK